MASLGTITSYRNIFHHQSHYPLTKASKHPKAFSSNACSQKKLEKNIKLGKRKNKYTGLAANITSENAIEQQTKTEEQEITRIHCECAIP